MFSDSSVLRMRAEDNQGINEGRKIKWRKKSYISSKSDELTTRRFKKKKQTVQWFALAIIPKFGGRRHKLELSVPGSLPIRVTEKQYLSCLSLSLDVLGPFLGPKGRQICFPLDF